MARGHKLQRLSDGLCSTADFNLKWSGCVEFVSGDSAFIHEKQPIIKWTTAVQYTSSHQQQQLVCQDLLLGLTANK
jgi:hypothetical protein